MFIFESSTDKETKLKVQTKFNEAIAFEPKYEENKQFLLHFCQNSNKKAIEKLVDIIKETIKDDDITPKKKYYSIKLLQDVMKSHNKVLGNYVVKKILQRLVIFAEYKKQSKDENRGKSIFGAVKPNEQTYAKKFHLTVLSCFEEWGTTWPRGSDGPHQVFSEKYKELLQKVTFPKTMSNASEVLRQKVNKDKVQIKGLIQPKKFISPERKQSKEKRNQEKYSSGNLPKGIDQNKIIEINTLILNIDETFNVLEEMCMQDPDPEVINPTVDSIHNELLKGDDVVGYLMSQNSKQYEPIINDVTGDFQFIEEIKHDVKGLRTPKGKQQFKRKYKEKFDQRRARRNQNQLQMSMISKQISKPKDNEGRNSINSKKSQDNPPNFYYPSFESANNKKSSFNNKNMADSVTIGDIKKRIESNRESERSKQNGSDEISSDQHTGKFKTFRHEEVTQSPQEQTYKSPQRMAKKDSNQNKLTPREAMSRNHSESSKPSDQSSSLTNSKPPEFYQPPPPIKQVPLPPAPQSSSSSNIHSTSIMKKVDSSNLINQSSSKDKSGFSSENPFSGSSKQNPIRSNPFESFESIKKPIQSNNMFSSFGKSSLKQSSKEQSGPKTKQFNFGKIQQNIYQSEENISEKRKRSLVGNPFDGDSIMSMEKQKTNPFDSVVSQSQHQFGTNNSNPFATGKSFFQKSNPFLSDSIDSNKNQMSNPFDSLKDKSIVDKNNTSQSNLFIKKSRIDFKFDIDDEDIKKSESRSEIKPSLKESDFAEKPEIKEDFFKNFVAQQVEPDNQKSFLDGFPEISKKPSEDVEGFFNEIKNSHIMTKKEMATSNIQFDWFNPEKKQKQPEPQNSIYPKFFEFQDPKTPRTPKEDNKAPINFNQFNPPEVNISVTPKQSRVSHNKEIRDPTNPWPEIEDLSQSEFPHLNIQQPQPVPPTNTNFFSESQKQNQVQQKDTQRSRAIENPFGVPNPQFDHLAAQKPKKNDFITPRQLQNEIQVPTSDADGLLDLKDFGVVVTQGGSPWNPFKRKPAEVSPKRQLPVSKFQLANLESQLKEAKQFYQQEARINQNLKEQFANQRVQYLKKMEQLEALSLQKQEYQNLIKKSRENISGQESNIAQQSKRVNQLKSLKDRKNICLKKLFELRNHQLSVNNKFSKSSCNLSSKVNKFLAFNQNAKNLHSMAVSNVNPRDNVKITSFHHRH